MNVLTLCHGNRFRSPFAAGLLKRQCPKLGVESAGMRKPIGNYPAGKPAREAAVLRGFDLSEHRAQGLSPSLVRWADIILYMDGGNYKRLIDQFPSARLKSKCLATYVDRTRIPDPNYLTGAPRDEVWVLLDEACKEFIERL